MGTTIIIKRAALPKRPCIRFEDLTAATILRGSHPHLRGVLQVGLDSLQEGAAGLLPDLVGWGGITPQEAERVERAVEATARRWEIFFLSCLLERAGLSPAQVEELVEAHEHDSEQLVARAAQTLHLSPDDTRELRFRARVALDQEKAHQVETYLAAWTASFEDPAPQTCALPDSSTRLPAPEFSIPRGVNTATPQMGESLGGYRILGLVGQGGMSVVYLTDHSDYPGRPTALKVLRCDASAESEGRFKREIFASSLLSHPNIIEVYDTGITDDQRRYLAMEFFPGHDLDQILNTELRLSPERALCLVRQVFAALGAAHQAGVVHRDVKPGNIVVSPDGEQAKLMDFGIAVISDATPSPEERLFESRDGFVIGTPRYMSPEQADGDPITPSSDLYSMGVVLYELLTGQLPFDGITAAACMTAHMFDSPEPMSTANPTTASLPSHLHSLVDRLLAKHPNDRPANADEVVTAIDLILEWFDLPSLPEAKEGRPAA